MLDLSYAELFAGAGGMSIGLEAAGWRCVAHAEIEPHARAVLRQRWPDVPLYGDVTQLNGADFKGITLLTGGSPCQDLSIAGKRAGMTEGSGTRSSLFFEQVRIWKESEAPLILWENVYGAFSSNNGRDFAAVLSAIVGAAVAVPADGWRNAGVASGPAGVAAWRTVDAQHFGWNGNTTPQRRRRVFVLGTRTGSVDPAEVLLVRDGLLGHLAAGGKAGEGVAADAGAGVEGESGCLTPWDAQSKRVFSSKGWEHTFGAAENSGQQQQAVFTYDTRGNGDGRIVNTLAGDHQNRVTDYTAVVLGTTVSGVDKQQGIPFDDTAPTLKTDLAHQMGPVVAVTLRNREGKPGGGKGPLLSEGQSLTLGTHNDQVVFTKTQYGAYENRPSVASTLGARDHASLNVDIAVMATGQVNAQVVRDGCPPLTATNEQPIAFVGVGIPRRLMPVECERLMGWPDQWTAHGIDEKGREYALSDTARYKLCGNGIASPVTAWIGMRLREVLDSPRPAL